MTCQILAKIGKENDSKCKVAVNWFQDFVEIEDAKDYKSSAWMRERDEEP